MAENVEFYANVYIDHADKTEAADPTLLSSKALISQALSVTATETLTSGLVQDLPFPDAFVQAIKQESIPGTLL